MEIDSLDPRLYDDPFATYQWLRDEAPVYWDAKNEIWVVSRHEDVSHVSRHQELYSAANGVRPKIAAPMSIIAMDDPEHTRQRRLINKGFTPRTVRELTPHMRELANEIIDEIAHRGECDFVEEMAAHVPLIIIAELMGLDPQQRAQLYKWSDAMMAGDGHIDPESPQLHNAAVAFGEYVEMCLPLIEERRGSGEATDIISILVNAHDEGGLARTDAGGAALPIEDTLNSDELLMFLVLLVVAGNETTRNALSGGLLAFSRFPEQKQKLLDNPELITTAVDEIVRFVTPVLTFCRTVTETHEYQGQTLEAGQQVLMLYQSANRDPRVFEDPDEFRIDRDPNPHLGFGIGTHFCLGANLARAEVTVVFEELFKRLRDIRVADPDAPLDRGDSSLVLALQHLPAVFTPVPLPA